MDPIKEAFQKVKEEMDELKQHISQIYQEIDNIKRTLKTKTQIIQNIDTPSFPVDRQTDTSTDNLSLEAVKSQNPIISTRNKGVKTDRQTHRQTDNTLNQVPEVLETLDNIKEEVRFIFKQLTHKEIEIFSLVYQLEEKGLVVDYPLLAQHLSITESSVRDHILRIIRKGIPIEKKKENNKKIILSISKNLKEIAPLDSILKLRDL